MLLMRGREDGYLVGLGIVRRSVNPVGKGWDWTEAEDYNQYHQEGQGHGTHGDANKP